MKNVKSPANNDRNHNLQRFMNTNVMYNNVI